MTVERPHGWQHRLAEELTRLSDAVRRAAVPLQPAEMPATMVAGGADHARHVAMAVTIYEQRRRRAECFPNTEELFQDPAWDMLLHLFIAAERGTVESRGSAAIASGINPRVAARWLLAMKEAALVELLDEEDPVTSVRISPGATRMMRRYLDGLSGEDLSRSDQ